MPAAWKKKFSPDVILKNIAKTRTVGSEGKGASFSGFNLDYCVPMLNSMLNFPSGAEHLDHASLIWKAAANDPADLSPVSFLRQLNLEISKELSKKVQKYHVLTSISLNAKSPLGSLSLEEAKIFFRAEDYPNKFKTSRISEIKKSGVPVEDKTKNYIKIQATLEAKSEAAAYAVASRNIDAYRALWCLRCNPTMEIIGIDWNPINVIRLGPIHTIHMDDGLCASQIWFEPYHSPASAYAPKDFLSTRKFINSCLTRLRNCPYQEAVKASLVVYVRALDEWNQSNALIRLWSALEMLASPGHGNYDAVIRRCAFLWTDADFATQTLEHLRDYRNGLIHLGAERAEAKSHCFQLQQHYRALVYFHLGQSGRFRTLDDANRFLDLPNNLTELKVLELSLRRAKRFKAPLKQPKKDEQ